MTFYKAGESVSNGGTFVEVGHGGGKLKAKNRQTVEVKAGDKLPALKTSTSANTKIQNATKKVREHKWLRVKA